MRLTPAGLEVAQHDGRPLDAVVRADAAIILGLAAGMLALEDVRGEAEVEGDEAAVRAVFGS